MPGRADSAVGQGRLCFGLATLVREAGIPKAFVDWACQDLANMDA